LAAELLIYAFYLLGIEMVEGETLVFDLTILQAAQSPRSARPLTNEATRNVSVLGNTMVLILLTWSVAAAWQGQSTNNRAVGCTGGQHVLH
jgi:hypothetical protein